MSWSCASESGESRALEHEPHLSPAVVATAAPSTAPCNEAVTGNLPEGFPIHWTEGQLINLVPAFQTIPYLKRLDIKVTGQFSKVILQFVRNGARSITETVTLTQFAKIESGERPGIVIVLMHGSMGQQVIKAKVIIRPADQLILDIDIEKLILPSLVLPPQATHF